MSAKKQSLPVYSLSRPDGAPSLPFIQWLQSIDADDNMIKASGTTANRPAGSMGFPLWVGYYYFDTTLGKPIWLTSLSPTVWVDATGGAV